MVHRQIHVRPYTDNKKYHTVQWFTETYMYVYIYIDNKPYSTMVHRHIHVRTYIDNKPCSTIVQRHIHVRTYIDNKPYNIQWFTDTYMYVYI